MAKMLKSGSGDGSQPPSFFKFLLGDFQNKLLLPRAFIKNYNGNVPKEFMLRSPTGISWIVSVKEIDKDFFLCNQWSTFASDHALELGQLLVFRYNDYADLGVTIFGLNACRKEVVPLAKKSYFEGRENDEENRQSQAPSSSQEW